MGVRVVGFATPEKLAVILGSNAIDAASRLAALVEAGSVQESKIGARMTPAGVEELERLIVEEGARTSGELEGCYARFTTIDPLVKKASVTSQDNFEEGVDQLLTVHDRAKGCVRKIATCVPRYEPYRTRLDSAVERIVAGDKKSFTASQFPPDSYHQAWWELHTDLVTTLGVEKED